MMTCKICQAPIPEKYLHCEQCLKKLSWRSSVRQQHLFLEDIFAGKRKVLIAKPAQDRLYHLGLINIMNSQKQAWCGRIIRPGWRDQRILELKNVDKETLCTECLKIFGEEVSTR